MHANLTLASSFAGGVGPAGGVRLRLRAPLHCGQMKAVSVGGVPWPHFDAADEAIVFEHAALTPKLLRSAQDIVATFG